jgi:hypothetical protein
VRERQKGRSGYAERLLWLQRRSDALGDDLADFDALTAREALADAGQAVRDE